MGQSFSRQPIDAGSQSRRSPRRAFNRAIGLLRGGVYDLGEAIQISESGLSFVTESRLQVEDRCVVTLVIPGGGCLVLRGSVITERAKIGRMNSYGIEFRALDLHQRRMVRAYVSAKTQAESELEDS